MIVGEALREAAQRLAATSDTARLDAELLMAHALGVKRSDMLLNYMACEVPSEFARLVERRAAHEPIAYITGSTEFYGLELEVAPGVLIPRGDSETLIEAAREAFAEREPPATILDLGTGSGALLFAATSVFPSAVCTGIDASPAVAKIFARNAKRHGEGRQIVFEVASWREPNWADRREPADLILCNPPYVEDDAILEPDVRGYEPASALFAGPEGLDEYHILISQLRKLMAADGIALFEIGATQAQAVSEIAHSHGFSVQIRNDLANRPRCAVLW